MAIGDISPQLRERRPQLNSLTSLRVVGMVLVFIVHGSFEIVFKSYDLGLAYLEGVGTSGQTAVSYFFVLSGFVLAWSWREKDTARTFWRRRAVRIFPNHVVALAFTVVLAAFLTQLPDLFPLFTQLILVQSWFPSPRFTDVGNSATWSLSVDIGFYALFPLLLPLIRRIRPERLWYAVGGVAVVIALIPVAANLFLPDTPPTPLWHTSESRYWFVYFFPAARMLECVLGMLMARIVITGRWTGLRPLPAAALLVVMYTIAQQLPFLYRYAAVIAVPVALLLASLAVADIAGRRTYLTGRTMVRLGELTFAFYLIHGPVLNYGHLMLGYTMDGGMPKGKAWGAAGGLAFLAGAFLVSLALAWVMNVCIERPAVRHWARRRTPKTAPVQVSA
ncbi:acyltransferase family protein [Streptomyces sp. NPDC052042]|uniref:acyltransferase family protein n=1 Tax=Streptomyces sp. NPDC052042 TaxID=3365683 RepID=UPI0037D327D8